MASGLENIEKCDKKHDTEQENGIPQAESDHFKRQLLAIQVSLLLEIHLWDQVVRDKNPGEEQGSHKKRYDLFHSD